MSQNVEFVRNVYAMLDRGSTEVWDLVPRDFVLDFSRRLINPVVLRGPEVRGFMEREWQVWEGESVGWQIEELIDAGDKVLAFVRTGGRGKMSGVEVQARVWNVWTFRNGKPVELTYFGDDRAAALEAVGLSEQDAHADS